MKGRGRGKDTGAAASLEPVPATAISVIPLGPPAAATLPTSLSVGPALNRSRGASRPSRPQSEECRARNGDRDGSCMYAPEIEQTQVPSSQPKSCIPPAALGVTSPVDGYVPPELGSVAPAALPSASIHGFSDQAEGTRLSVFNTNGSSGGSVAKGGVIQNHVSVVHQGIGAARTFSVGAAAATSSPLDVGKGTAEISAGTKAMDASSGSSLFVGSAVVMAGATSSSVVSMAPPPVTPAKDTGTPVVSGFLTAMRRS